MWQTALSQHNVSSSTTNSPFSNSYASQSLSSAFQNNIVPLLLREEKSLTRREKKSCKSSTSNNSVQRLWVCLLPLSILLTEVASGRKYIAIKPTWLTGLQESNKRSLAPPPANTSLGVSFPPTSLLHDRVIHWGHLLVNALLLNLASGTKQHAYLSSSQKSPR